MSTVFTSFDRRFPSREPRYKPISRTGTHFGPFIPPPTTGAVSRYSRATLPNPAYDDGHSPRHPFRLLPSVRGYPRKAMSLIRDMYITYSGPQILDDLARTVTQVTPSLRLSFLPIYVLHIVLRWLLVAPAHAREALRRCIRELRSRMRRRSRLPRLHFAETGADAETGLLNVRYEKGIRRMAFRDFVRSKCPSLFREYRPSKLLFK